MHSVAWNCTGTKLASGSVDQTARVWLIEPHGHVSLSKSHSLVCAIVLVSLLLLLVKGKPLF